MSTRSFIGFNGYLGFTHNLMNVKGVYCHSDGYPSGTGQHLYHLAQMYTELHLLSEYIMDKPNGYSFLVGWSGNPDDLMGYDKFHAKEGYEKHDNGYGVYYDGERAITGCQHPTLDKVWYRYAYIIYQELRIMVVYVNDNNLPKKIGVVDFDAPMPDWFTNLD